MSKGPYNAVQGNALLAQLTCHVSFGRLVSVHPRPAPTNPVQPTVHTLVLEFPTLGPAGELQWILVQRRVVTARMETWSTEGLVWI